MAEAVKHGEHFILVLTKDEALALSATAFGVGGPLMEYANKLTITHYTKATSMHVKDNSEYPYSTAKLRDTLRAIGYSVREHLK